MFMNLDTLPVGYHMFTIAVTDIEPGTVHRADVYFDEVDVVAPARSGPRHLGRQRDEYIVLEDASLSRVIA